MHAWHAAEAHQGVVRHVVQVGNADSSTGRCAQSQHRQLDRSLRQSCAPLPHLQQNVTSPLMSWAPWEQASVEPTWGRVWPAGTGWALSRLSTETAVQESGMVPAPVQLREPEAVWVGRQEGGCQGRAAWHTDGVCARPAARQVWRLLDRQRASWGRLLQTALERQCTSSAAKGSESGRIHGPAAAWACCSSPVSTIMASAPQLQVKAPLELQQKGRGRGHP
jgi:hypothetical protein